MYKKRNFSYSWLIGGLGLMIGLPVLAAPNINATVNDTLSNDVAGDNSVDRGDEIEYEITVTNSAALPADNATGVEIDGGLDANATLVPGSIMVSPLAYADTYTALGGANLTVGVANGLRSNDRDPDDVVTNLVVTLQTPPAGGTVNINADGSFIYNAPAAPTGSDSFTYTLTDSDGMTDTGTVTINFSGNALFVDGNAPTGTGTQADPFVTISEATAAASAGDTIFVFFNATPYDENVTGLQNNQNLIGEAEGLVIDGNTIVAATANRPVVQAISGNVVGLSEISGVSVKGFAFESSIASPLSASFFSSGNFDLSLENNIFTTTGGTGHGVDLNAGNFGTANLSLLNNTFAIQSGNSINISHSGSGDATISIDSNTIDTTNGVDAISITGTSSTANTIVSIDNNSNIIGGEDGIVLDGTAGNLFVTSLSNNSVSDNTPGRGLFADSVTFDATPGGTFDAVNGGTLTIGGLGVGPAASAMSLANVEGNLSFTSLNVFNHNASSEALSIDNFGGPAYDGSQGFLLTVADGSIGSNQDGMFVEQATVNMSLSSFTASGGNQAGIRLQNIAGDLTFNNATISDGLGGVTLQNTTANVTYHGSIGPHTGGDGDVIDISNMSAGTVIFDTGTISTEFGSAGLSFDTITGGSITIDDLNIGQTTPVGFEGISLLNNTGGSLTINNLDLATNNATGINGLAGNTTGFTFNVGTGNLQSTLASPILLDNINTGITFNSIITGNLGNGVDGISLANLSGSFTANNVQIGSTTGDSFQRGIYINSGSANFNFATSGTVALESRNAEAILIEGAPSGFINFGHVTIAAQAQPSSDAIRISGNTNPVTFGDISLADSGGNGISLINGAGNIIANSFSSTGNISSSAVNISGNSANVTFTNGINIASAVTGFSVSGGSGTFTFGSSSNPSTITSADFQGFSISGSSTANVTYHGDITQGTATSGNSFVINDHSVGTVLFDSGTLTDSQIDGATFTNADGTYQFNSTVNLSGGNSSLTIGAGSDGSFTFDDANLTGSGSRLVIGDINGIQNQSPDVNFSGTINPTSGFDFAVEIARISDDGSNQISITPTTFSETNGSGVSISQTAVDVSVSNMNINGGVDGIQITSSTGTMDFSNAFIQNLSGAPIAISTDASSLTYQGSIAHTGSNAVLSINDHTTGTVTLSSGGSDTINATNGTGYQFTSADGVYNIQTPTTFNGGDAGIDIISDSSGTFTFDSVDITNPAGDAIAVSGQTSGSTATINFNGSVSKNNSGQLLFVQNYQTNTFTLNTTSFTGTGVTRGVQASFVNNGGAIVFNNPVDITNATSGGVTFSSSTDGSLSFADLDINNSTSNAPGISATGGTFNITTGTINSGEATAFSGSGAALGVTLRNLTSNPAGNVTSSALTLTNTTGSFSVIGDGTNTLSNVGGIISQRSTGFNGIILNNANNVSLRQLEISDILDHGVHVENSNNFSIQYSTLTNNGGDGSLAGILLQNVSGTVNVANNSISAGTGNGVEVAQTQNTNPTVNIVNNTFKDNDGSQFSALTTNPGSLVPAPSVILNIAGNSIDITGAISGADGIAIDAQDDSAITFDIDNHTSFRGNFLSRAVRIEATGQDADTATLVGHVRNNRFNDWQSGIFVNQTDSGSVVINIDNNELTDSTSAGESIGILAGNGDSPAGKLDATVTNNRIANSVTSGDDIFIQSNQNAVVCSDIRGNNTLGSSTTTSINIEQVNAAIFRLESSGGPVAYLQGANTVGTAPVASGTITPVAAGSCTDPA